jgi:solute carrier family 25 folate transporter 32
MSEEVKIAEITHSASILGGISAGIISTIICAPLDVAKLRMQVQGALGIFRYTGSPLRIVRDIYKEEGVRGPYRGLLSGLITLPIFFGLYWPIYESMKVSLTDNTSISLPGVHILSAVVAEATANIITNPLWVIRTRIQALSLHGSHSPSITRVAYELYHYEGIKSFSHGISASMLGLSFAAIQFPLCKSP